jgi:hypothetical protein
MFLQSVGNYPDVRWTFFQIYHKIKTGLQEMVWEVVEWIELAQDRDKCWDLVNTVMNAQNFLSGRGYATSSRRVLLLRVSSCHLKNRGLPNNHAQSKTCFVKNALLATEDCAGQGGGGVAWVSPYTLHINMAHNYSVTT